MKNNYSTTNNLKKIRERRGYTLKQLAEITGLTIHEIHFLETDRLDLRKSKFDTVIKLCDSLRITPYEIFVDKEYAKTLLTITKRYYGKKYIAKQ